MISRLLVLLAAAVAALALTAARAGAGTYAVTSCHGAGGAPLPVADAGGGWHPEYGRGRTAEDRCDGGPGLVATIGTNVAADLGAQALWRFAAPAGTWISAYRLEYSGYARPYGYTETSTQGVVGVADGDRGTVASHEGAGEIAARTLAVAGRHAPWVALYAQCDAPEDHPPCEANVVTARAVLSRSLVELTDATPPSSGPAGGSAADSASWDGRERLTAAVHDTGGGLWRWALSVDGAERTGGPVEPASATCAPDRAFVVPRPCPLDADLLLDLDTTALPAGTHDVTLRVLDAAGNGHTVFSGRRTIAGADAPSAPPRADDAPAPAAAALPSTAPAAARLTAHWAHTTARTLTVAFGAHPVLRGRLTRADGAPVRGAAIALSLRGADAGGARTRPDGTFTLVLPAGRPSATVELRHRPTGARASLRLRVRAGVTLRVRRTGRRLAVLSGRLRGRPLPRGGRLVELQARGRGGRWLTFRTVRTHAGGRFALRYRFRTQHPERFALRARARAAGGYPYATGASAPVGVR